MNELQPLQMDELWKMLGQRDVIIYQLQKALDESKNQIVDLLKTINKEVKAE